MHDAVADGGDGGLGVVAVLSPSSSVLNPAGYGQDDDRGPLHGWRSQEDARFYAGLTDDRGRRYQEHQSDKVPSTRARGPLELP